MDNMTDDTRRLMENWAIIEGFSNKADHQNEMLHDPYFIDDMIYEHIDKDLSNPAVINALGGIDSLLYKAVAEEQDKVDSALRNMHEMGYDLDELLDTIRKSGIVEKED